MTIKTKHFGSLIYTKEDGADFKVASLELNNKRSQCTLMIFDGFDEQEIVRAIEIIDNLESLDAISRNEISSSYDSENQTVNDFINEHFNDYGEDIAKDIYAKLNVSEQDDLAFIENLELGSVSVSKRADDLNSISTTLDYNVLWSDGISFTDQILAVTFDQEMKFIYLSHES